MSKSRGSLSTPPGLECTCDGGLGGQGRDYPFKMIDPPGEPRAGDSSVGPKRLVQDFGYYWRVPQISEKVEPPQSSSKLWLRKSFGTKSVNGK